MNIIVHLMFAMTLRQRVKKSLGVSLSLPGFLYGNILPDISKKYGPHPHYMKDALLHVDKTKENILYNNNNEYLSKYQYAKELGAINHYLSDFFCLPHTERYNRGKFYHQYYEFLMIARFRKGLNGYRRMLKNNDTPISPNELIDFILSNNKDYAKKRSSDINDIRYALFAGIKLIECIVTHSILSQTIIENRVTAQAL